MNLITDGIVIEYCEDYFQKCYIFDSWAFTYFQVLIFLGTIMTFIFLLRWAYLKGYNNKEKSDGGTA